MFWISLILLTSCAALWVLAPLLAGRGAPPGRASFDRQVYRDQLAEIERDLARGVIEPREAEASRTEIARRLLAADAEARKEARQKTGMENAQKAGADRPGVRPKPGAEPASPAPRGLQRAGALGVLLTLLVGFALVYFGTERLLTLSGLSDARVAALKEATSVSLALPGGSVVVNPVYRGVGNPELADAPLANRSARVFSQAEAEALLAANGVDPAPAPAPENAQLMPMIAQLREIVVARPNEIQAYRFLSRALGSIGHYAEAQQVQGRLLLQLGAAARAEDHATHAELMILAAGDYVSPQAAQALDEALRRDPTLPRARYYAGLGLAQNNRLREAYDLWARLLQEGPPDAPWIAPIEARIGPLASALGAPLPDAVSTGPTSAEIEAARALDPSEREEMIRDMVEGLSRRLAIDGGPAQDWARLIRSLGVLGEIARARTIWGEAQDVFANDARALATIRAAAQSIGLGP
ncbi:MAG: c-type cytochrome biogenesis protein CcmI [Pseudomonadota bacterium]